MRLNLRVIKIPLDIFGAIYSTLDCHLRFDWTIMPRNLIVLKALFLKDITISWVLFKLIDNLFTSNHLTKASTFKAKTSSILALWDFKLAQMSSAYRKQVVYYLQYYKANHLHTVKK